MNYDVPPELITVKTDKKEYNFTRDEMKSFHRLCRLRSTLENHAILHHRDEHGKFDEGFNLVISNFMKQLYRLASKGAYRKFHDTDLKLHYTLVASCEFPALTKCWETVLGDLNDWLIHVKRRYWPSLMALYREHSLLIAAWQSPDNWVAEEATHQHLEAGWYRVAASQEDLRPEFDPVNRTASYISTHFASNLSIEWIASHVSFVSSSHLSRLFRQHMNLSPKAYLKQVRMEKAAELLVKSDMKIQSLAVRVGYKNTSHFIRDFHNHFGVTPLKYHKQKNT